MSLTPMHNFFSLNNTTQYSDMIYFPENMAKTILEIIITMHLLLFTSPNVKIHTSFTISSEDVNVKLLKQVHDESVNLREQPDEEDDGKAQGEN